MSLRRRCALRISGKVQGVGFRVEARRRARRLGVAGFVRNEPDSSVFIVAEGEEAALAAFIAWCAKGPWWAARVERVEEEPCPAGDFGAFEIR